MADDTLVAFGAATFLSGTQGRGFAQIRQNLLVVDGPYEGPGEAPGAAELFVSGISTCAALMVERIAAAEKLPLKHVNVTIDAAFDMARTFDGPALLDRAHLHFVYKGINKTQAKRLTGIFEAKCPLYGTLKTATPATTVMFETKR